MQQQQCVAAASRKAHPPGPHLRRIVPCPSQSKSPCLRKLVNAVVGCRWPAAMVAAEVAPRRLPCPHTTRTLRRTRHVSRLAAQIEQLAQQLLLVLGLNAASGARPRLQQPPTRHGWRDWRPAAPLALPAPFGGRRRHPLTRSSSDIPACPFLACVAMARWSWGLSLRRPAASAGGACGRAGASALHRPGTELASACMVTGGDDG